MKNRIRRTSLPMAVFVGCALLSGCLPKDEPFELAKSGNQTYLLNKRTGELKLVEGTTLAQVKLPDNSAPTPRSLGGRREVPDCG